jgi:prenyltransferase beta subunit
MGTDASLSYVDVAFHLWSEPDAEAAMAFIFIPTVQIFISLISIGLLVGIGEWLARRRDKGAGESVPSSDR